MPSSKKGKNRAKKPISLFVCIYRKIPDIDRFLYFALTLKRIFRKASFSQIRHLFQEKKTDLSVYKKLLDSNLIIPKLWNWLLDRLKEYYRLYSDYSRQTD